MTEGVSYKVNTDKRGLVQDVSIQDLDFRNLVGTLDVTDVELSDHFSVITEATN